MRMFDELYREVTACRKCPRLVQFRESVEPRACFKGETYWKKPVPGFGDEKAWLLILGLAPAAHGGNRTGRILTGDLTAKFLFEALFKMGWSNLPQSLHLGDGLKLNGLYLTASVKCVPPQDKPTPVESASCHSYLTEEIHLLTHLKAVLCLGKIAFDAAKKYAEREGYPNRGITFAHGARYDIPGLFTLWGSYHTSPRNTNTGRLTPAMFLSLLKKIEQDYNGKRI